MVMLADTVHTLFVSAHGHFGELIATDFLSFWTASWLGLHGNAVGAYDLSTLQAAQQIAVHSDAKLPWLYPPTFFLLILPLATLPYTAAWFGFMSLTLLPFFLLLRRLLVAQPLGLWLIASFPALWVNLKHGQNAALTAALVGFTLILMANRPVLAGLFAALLTVKPHMALLLPLVFVATGAWRTLFTAGVGVLALAAVSSWFFGLSIWPAWLHSLDFARQMNESGSMQWHKMATVFSALRLLDLPASWAYVGHAVTALIAITLLLQVWRRSSELALRGSAFVTATLLVSPHFFIYDLLWLALPLAWLAIRSEIHGWLRGERTLLLLAWLQPLFGPIVALQLGLQVMPLINLALLIVIWQKARITTP